MLYPFVACPCPKQINHHLFVVRNDIFPLSIRLAEKFSLNLGKTVNFISVSNQVEILYLDIFSNRHFECVFCIFEILFQSIFKNSFLKICLLRIFIWLVTNWRCMYARFF